ncbi:MAG: hypothetical protein ACTSYM_03950 [Candidatus Baldrarchaeia archaeon]
MKKKLCQVSSGNSIFNEDSLEKKGLDASERVYENMDSKSWQVSRRNENFVEKENSKKLEDDSERVSKNKDNITLLKTFLIESIIRSIDSYRLNCKYNNIIYVVSEIEDSIKSIKKTLESKIAVFILYLGYKLPLFYLNLVKKLVPEVSKYQISSVLNVLEASGLIRKVGKDEFLEQKLPFLTVINQNSKSPLNAERVRFYVLTDRGKKFVKIFKDHIESMIESYLPRIKDYKYVIRKTHRRLETEAKRKLQKSQYYRCDSCGFSFPYEMAVRNHFRCNRCGKPLKPVGGNISYTVSDTLIEGEKMREEFLSREEKIVKNKEEVEFLGSGGLSDTNGEEPVTDTSKHEEKQGICRNCKFYIPSKGLPVGCCQKKNRAVTDKDTCSDFEPDFYSNSVSEHVIGERGL